jgi:hypothetical protein
MSPALVSMNGSPVGSRAAFTVTEALNAALSGPQQGMAPLACGFTAFRAASAEQGATHVRPTWRSGCRLAGAANIRRTTVIFISDTFAYAPDRQSRSVTIAGRGRRSRSANLRGQDLPALADNARHGIGGLEQFSGSLLLAGRDGRVDDRALSRLRPARGLRQHSGFRA